MHYAGGKFEFQRARDAGKPVAHGRATLPVTWPCAALDPMLPTAGRSGLPRHRDDASCALRPPLRASSRQGEAPFERAYFVGADMLALGRESLAASTSTFSMEGGLDKRSGAFAISAAAI